MGRACLASNYCHPIRDIISSAVIDCGAACGNSYPGRAWLWNNIVDNPADADPLSSGPFFLGSGIPGNTSAPVFTGRAGQKGSRFIFGTSGFLIYTGRTQDSPAKCDGMYRKLQRTTGGQDWTFLTTIKYKANAAIQVLFSNQIPGAHPGIAIFIGANGKINCTQRGDSAVVTALHDEVLVDGTRYLIGVGHTASSTKFWLGTATADVQSHAFNTCVTDASGVLSVGCNFPNVGVVGSPLASGAEMYDVQAYNECLDNTKMALALAALEARNGLDFSP